MHSGHHLTAYWLYVVYWDNSRGVTSEITLPRTVNRDSYEDESMPEYPGLFLGVHVVSMTSIMGSACGGAFAVGTKLAHRLRGRNSISFIGRLLRNTRNGVVIGSINGAAMVLGKAAQSEDM